MTPIPSLSHTAHQVTHLDQEQVPNTIALAVREIRVPLANACPALRRCIQKHKPRFIAKRLSGGIGWFVFWAGRHAEHEREVIENAVSVGCRLGAKGI